MSDGIFSFEKFDFWMQLKDLSLWPQMKRELHSMLYNLPKHAWERFINSPYHRLGRTPLILAATVNHEEACEFLLYNGAAPNVKSYECLWTPLHMAAMNNNYNLVKLFLRFGSNPASVARINSKLIKRCEHFRGVATNTNYEFSLLPEYVTTNNEIATIIREARLNTTIVSSSMNNNNNEVVLPILDEDKEIVNVDVETNMKRVLENENGNDNEEMCENVKGNLRGIVKARKEENRLLMVKAVNAVLLKRVSAVDVIKYYKIPRRTFYNHLKREKQARTLDILTGKIDVLNGKKNNNNTHSNVNYSTVCYQ